MTLGFSFVFFELVDNGANTDFGGVVCRKNLDSVNIFKFALSVVVGKGRRL